MDLLWIILSILFLLTGIVGCIIPLLPGPPLAYIGLLLIQLKSDPPFSFEFMLIWAGIVVVISVLDYLIPVYGTKKFGGTKYGMWGCMIGLLAGIWLGPWGIILGPFFGALIGEMLGNNQSGAIKAAFGSFVGFIFSTLIKLVACCIMGWYTITSLF
jgi:uncharacterized protein YqgC (DUF456 family)